MKFLSLSLFSLSVIFAVAACGDDDDTSAASGGAGGTGATGGGGLAGGTGGGPAGGTAGLGGATNTGGNLDAGSSSGGADAGGAGGASGQALSFFVSSDVSATGNLGGLKGADQRCQALAEAVGVTNRTFRAYLSADADSENAGMPVNARDRIGTGPWYNSKGVFVAADIEALHTLIGDAELFIDEHGQKIPGQWEGSPKPVEHDILTGSNADGTLSPGKTCSSWTSADAGVVAVVGHSDGLGPNMATTGTYTSWNSSHDNMDCSNTAPRGGAGRIYCFAAD